MALTPVQQQIVAAAQKQGVDPALALAIAYNESGFNKNAVGDNGTSYGVYQLHRGGELGSLTPSQAFDVTTNANVALSQVAAVAKTHSAWSAGQIAAAAQRPASAETYAATINSLMPQMRTLLGTGVSAGTATTAGTTGTAGVAGGAGTAGTGVDPATIDAAAQAVGATAAGLTGSDISGIYSQACLISTPRIFGIGGACLLSKAEGWIILGGGLMILGGAVATVGLLAVAAYGFQRSGAGKVVGDTLQGVGGAISFVSPGVGLPVMAAGRAARAGHRSPRTRTPRTTTRTGP